MQHQILKHNCIIRLIPLYVLLYDLSSTEFKRKVFYSLCHASIVAPLCVFAFCSFVLCFNCCCASSYLSLRIQSFAVDSLRSDEDPVYSIHRNIFYCLDISKHQVFNDFLFYRIFILVISFVDLKVLNVKFLPSLNA